MQSNPWRDLPGAAPFVLPADRQAVDVFNRTASNAHRLRVDSPPEPFLGPLGAPIVVLLMNPGVDKEGLYHPGLADAIRDGDAAGKHLYLSSRSPFWDKLVRQPRRDRPDANVGAAVLSVEFFPYRSVSFGCGHVRLPSQALSFELVQRAMLRSAIVVIARGYKLWMGAVPALADYGDLVCLGNPRTASLSPGNFKAAGPRGAPAPTLYEKLLGALG